MSRTLEVGLDGGACSVHLASHHAWIGSRNEFDSKRLSMTFKMILNDNRFDSQCFHFFNTLYYICRAVTYSFTITYLEYFRAGNFRLKISTICTIHAKFKQYKIFTANYLKG